MNKRFFDLAGKIISILCGLIIFFILFIYLFNHYNKSGVKMGIDISDIRKNGNCTKEHGYYFDYLICSVSK